MGGTFEKFYLKFFFGKGQFGLKKKKKFVKKNFFPAEDYPKEFLVLPFPAGGPFVVPGCVKGKKTNLSLLFPFDF